MGIFDKMKRGDISGAFSDVVSKVSSTISFSNEKHNTGKENTINITDENYDDVESLFFGMASKYSCLSIGEVDLEARWSFGIPKDEKIIGMAQGQQGTIVLTKKVVAVFTDNGMYVLPGTNNASSLHSLNWEGVQPLIENRSNIQYEELPDYLPCSKYVGLINRSNESFVISPSEDEQLGDFICEFVHRFCNLNPDYINRHEKTVRWLIHSSKKSVSEVGINCADIDDLYLDLLSQLKRTEKVGSDVWYVYMERAIRQGDLDAFTKSVNKLKETEAADEILNYSRKIEDKILDTIYIDANNYPERFNCFQNNFEKSASDSNDTIIQNFIKFCHKYNICRRSFYDNLNFPHKKWA